MRLVENPASLASVAAAWLPAMAESDTKLQCFLSQRTFRSLGKLHNADYRSFSLGMSSQFLYVGFGVFTTNDCLLCFLSHFDLHLIRYGLLAQLLGVTTYGSLLAKRTLRPCTSKFAPVAR